MEIRKGNLVLGDGIPKICVPLTGKSRRELLEQAVRAAAFAPDLLEWRADFYEDVLKKGAAADMLRELSEAAGEIPLLFTFRSSGEGGARGIEAQSYEALLGSAVRSGRGQLVDVEVFMEGLDAEGLIQRLHAAGGIVVASNHHFDATPPEEEMEAILEEMERLGADVRKLAVMPRTPEDVLSLLRVTRRASQRGVHPVITMSMGRLGALSRISGALTGSAVTFASAGEASAPGQIPIEEMQRLLRMLDCREDARLREDGKDEKGAAKR